MAPTGHRFPDIPRQFVVLLLHRHFRFGVGSKVGGYVDELEDAAIEVPLQVVLGDFGKQVALQRKARGR